METYLFWLYFVSVISTAFFVARPLVIKQLEAIWTQKYLTEGRELKKARGAALIVSIIGILLSILTPFYNTYLTMLCIVNWSIGVNPKHK